MYLLKIDSESAFLQQLILDLRQLLRCSRDCKVGEHGYSAHLESESASALSTLNEFYQANQGVLSENLFFWETRPGMERFAVHKDAKQGQAVYSSLLFGLENCDEATVTSFYESAEQEGCVDSENGIRFLPEQADIIKKTDYVVKTDEAYFFDNSQWHGVVNQSGRVRVVASWWARDRYHFEDLRENLVLVAK